MRSWEKEIAKKNGEESDVCWLEELPTEKERSLCISFDNPCFWINCRFHLRPENNIWNKLTEEDKLKKLFSLEETCSLRLANEKGGLGKQEIARYTGLTLSVISSALSLAKRKIGANRNLLAIEEEYFE